MSNPFDRPDPSGIDERITQLQGLQNGFQEMMSRLPTLDGNPRKVPTKRADAPPEPKPSPRPSTPPPTVLQDREEEDEVVAPQPQAPRSPSRNPKEFLLETLGWGATFWMVGWVCSPKGLAGVAGLVGFTKLIAAFSSPLVIGLALLLAATYAHIQGKRGLMQSVSQIGIAYILAGFVIRLLFGI